MKSRLLFSLMLLIIVFGCNKEDIQAKREPKILQLPEKSQQIIQQSNKFGIDLFKATSQTEADNLMLSPYNVA